MKRVYAQLKELKPNPFKKDIQNGAIDEAAVTRIIESAERTSFWEQLVVREARNGYELAFGHNRLEAGKRIFGADHKISVQVEEYTDAQMFIAMADENAGDDETIEAQTDVVRRAHELLVENPEWCKAVSHCGTEAQSKYASHEHEHGSVNCVLAFLGENNWSRRKVGDFLKLAKKADAAVLSRADEGKISQQSAMALADLPKSTQKVAAKAIKEAETTLPVSAIEDIVERVKKMPTDKQQGAVERAVKSKAAAEQTKEAERRRKREANGKPKEKKQLPDVDALMEMWAAQVATITADVSELKPHKELISTHASFRNLDKKVSQLAALISELRPAKPTPEATRTARQEFPQLT